VSSLRVTDADEDVGAPAENLFIDGTAWVSGTPRTDTIPDLTFSFLAPVYPAILSKNSVFNILASNFDDHGKNHAF